MKLLKTIAIAEESNPLKQNMLLQSNILLIIEEVRNKVHEMFHQSNQLIPINNELIEIQEIYISKKHHINAVINHVEKESIRMVIFEEPIDNQHEKDWVLKNSIKFLLEYVFSAEKNEFVISPNDYTIRVYGSLYFLKCTLLDIFVDMLIELSLSKNKDFKKLFKDANFSNVVNSKRKVEFAVNNLNKGLNPNLKYLSFSSFFRDSNLIYEIPELVLFWQKYLYSFHSINNKHPLIKEHEDIYKYLPVKISGNINRKKLKSKFKKNCRDNGFYKLLILRKSSIGLKAEKKAQLDAIFNGDSKLGNLTIIPLSYNGMTNQLEHLFHSIIFEKV